MAATAVPAARLTDRLDALRRLDGAARSPRPPAPRSAKIELTSRCNYACRFCASRLRGQPQRDMAWPVFTRIAHGLREAGLTQLGLFYIGESFLHPQLVEAVRHAKHVLGFPYVFLTTNGSLADRARVEALLDAGLDSLKFALNFPSGVELARMADVRAEHFDAVVRNVLDACAARDAHERLTGRRCTVSASSLRFTDDRDTRMQPLLDALTPYLDEHYWLPAYGSHAHWPQCGDSAEPATPIACKPLPCWPLFTEAHVTVDGRLSACGLDHSRRFDMGDLERHSFLDAWHSPAFQRLRNAHLADDVQDTGCAHCIGY